MRPNPRSTPIPPLPYIAIDWGTSRRRAYLVVEGQVRKHVADDRGARAVTDFGSELAQVRAILGDYPVVMAGMVGSSVGWSVVPYASLPVDAAALARGAQHVADRAWIVPGICQVEPAVARGEVAAKSLRGDVMRGEEIQFLGAQAAGLVGPEGLLCQPGTHCKWAWIERGVLTRFVTAMTGELFALLQGGGSLIAASLDGPLPTVPFAPDGAFLRGVAEGARRDLAASLFRLRADALLGLRAEGEGAAFASGVLIGADVAARLDETPTDTVHLVADEGLGDLYAAAIVALGRSVVRLASDVAFMAGMAPIAAQILACPQGDAA